MIGHAIVSLTMKFLATEALFCLLDWRMSQSKILSFFIDMRRRDSSLIMNNDHKCPKMAQNIKFDISEVVCVIPC